MAIVQKYFEAFHSAIRTDYEMNQILREKRDIVLDRVRKDLQDKNRPSFKELLQGSFAIKTGVIPIGELSYDIDVGLRFGLRETEHSSVTVHGWVYEAVQGHTEVVESRGPCIRVSYADGYHVDLVPYAWWEDDSGTEHYKLGHKKAGWRPADPLGLLEFVKKARERYVNTQDSQTKTDQFRRCTRYLRRWDDVAIPKPSKAKPTGLAFVLLANTHLNPTFSLGGDPDDRAALEGFAKAAAATIGRIIAKKPTPEHEDILARLTDAEMDSFKARLRKLAEKLAKANAETDPVKACDVLREVFGSDFPVPDPQDTGKKSSAPAIITSSSSA